MKEAEGRIAELQRAVDTGIKLHKKRENEIMDLKASFEPEKAELIDDAKTSAIISIPESMLKMPEEVKAKGYVMVSWNLAAWAKRLKMLRGEKVEEVEDACTSGATKKTGANEVADAEKKEGDQVESDKV